MSVNPDPQAHAASLAQGRWFAALPPDFRQALLQHAGVRPLAAGERLFAAGDPCDGLYAVLAGRLRISTLDDSGREALLALVEPPQWFGEIALFDAQPRTHDAWADPAAPVLLLQVPQAPLLALLSEQPQRWQLLGQLVTQKLRATFAVLQDAALLPPVARLARRLVAMAEGFGDTPDHQSRRELHISQDQLGAMLSLSRQTVNQALGQLAAAGMVRVSRGVVEVLALERLKAQGAGSSGKCRVRLAMPSASSRMPCSRVWVD